MLLRGTASPQRLFGMAKSLLVAVVALASLSFAIHLYLHCGMEGAEDVAEVAVFPRGLDSLPVRMTEGAVFEHPWAKSCCRIRERPGPYIGVCKGEDAGGRRLEIAGELRVPVRHKSPPIGGLCQCGSMFRLRVGYRNPSSASLICPAASRSSPAHRRISAASPCLTSGFARLRACFSPML